MDWLPESEDGTEPSALFDPDPQVAPRFRHLPSDVRSHLNPSVGLQELGALVKRQSIDTLRTRKSVHTLSGHRPSWHAAGRARLPRHMNRRRLSTTLSYPLDSLSGADLNSWVAFQAAS